MNVNLKSLKRTHGDNAEEIMKKVLEIGDFGAAQLDYVGGFDISGLSDAKQAQIKKLVDGKEEKKEGNK